MPFKHDTRPHKRVCRTRPKEWNASGKVSTVCTNSKCKAKPVHLLHNLEMTSKPKKSKQTEEDAAQSSGSNKQKKIPMKPYPADSQFLGPNPPIFQKEKWYIGSTDPSKEFTAYVNCDCPGKFISIWVSLVFVYILLTLLLDDDPRLHDGNNFCRCLEHLPECWTSQRKTEITKKKFQNALHAQASKPNASLKRPRDLKDDAVSELNAQGVTDQQIKDANICFDKAKNAVGRLRDAKRARTEKQNNPVAETQPFQVSDEIPVRDQDGNVDGNLITGTHEPDFGRELWMTVFLLWLYFLPIKLRPRWNSVSNSYWIIVNLRLWSDVRYCKRKKSSVHRSYGCNFRVTYSW